MPDAPVDGHDSEIQLELPSRAVHGGYVAKLRCALCGTTAHRTVVYGYPSPELLEEARRGEVILGGCVIGEKVVWFCNDCSRKPDKPKLHNIGRDTTSK